MVWWLLKTEPAEFSIADLQAAPERCHLWDGVRNYQARNFLRQCRLGDRLFIYHSGIKNPGIAGLARICAEAVADPTQFDPDSPYYDARASRQAPRWLAVGVQFERETCFLPLATIRELPGIVQLPLVRKGCRLSVMPVAEEEALVLLGQLGLEE